jgi:hypothetical protein
MSVSGLTPEVNSAKTDIADVMSVIRGKAKIDFAETERG